MSVISFEGPMGSSKTTCAVALAYEEHRENGKKVISNDHLNFPYTHFSLEFFLEHLVDEEIENCILFLDEFYQIADSRSSSSKLNKVFTYFVVQCRKREVDMYFCTHNLDHLDLRVRRAVDIRGACRMKLEEPCRKCRCKRCGGSGKIYGDICDVCNGLGATGEVNGRPCDRCLGYAKVGTSRVSFLDRRLRKRYSMEVPANYYWHLFNTRERIPLQARILQGIDTAEVV